MNNLLFKKNEEMGNVINKLNCLLLKKDVTYPRNLMSVLPREGLTKKMAATL
jgi:hypothetical protein